MSLAVHISFGEVNCSSMPRVSDSGGPKWMGGLTFVILLCSLLSVGDGRGIAGLALDVRNSADQERYVYGPSVPGRSPASASSKGAVRDHLPMSSVQFGLAAPDAKSTGRGATHRMSWKGKTANSFPIPSERRSYSATAPGWRWIQPCSTNSGPDRPVAQGNRPISLRRQRRSGNYLG